MKNKALADKEFLEHYGVPGMKWGKSKGSSTSSSTSKKSTSTNPVKKLSDDDLRKKINRMQMEKQYKQLTSKEKSSGQKFVTDIITNAAKQTATSYVSKHLTKGLEGLIKTSTSTT